MAADNLKRIYITGDVTPAPPPGFVIDGAAPPVPPPPEGFVPDQTGMPYTGQRRMGDHINAQQDQDAAADDTASPYRDAQVPPGRLHAAPSPALP